MTTTHIILMLNAFVQLANSLLRLYCTFWEAVALAIWRRCLLRRLKLQACEKRPRNAGG